MTENANFWVDRPVAVTGAAGFLGNHLVKRLIDCGAEVVCLVRDWASQSQLFQPGLQDRIRIVWGDVRDQALQERLLNEREIKSVFHLAAQPIVSVANRNAVSTFESNIAGTWSLLEACRRCPTVSDIVVASSDKAYGASASLPYDESTSLLARHPYDVSKACGDMLAQSYAHTYDLPIAITRCGNFYGPGDQNWNRIVPGTIRALIRGEQPVIRSSGKCVRDYFYVEDGAAAYMMLAEHLAQDDTLRGEAFNFSNEQPLSVLEVVTRILEQMAVDVTPIVQDAASHEIQEQYLSAAKARSVLSWQPHYSLQQGLALTIAWYREHLSKHRLSTSSRRRSA